MKLKINTIWIVVALIVAEMIIGFNDYIRELYEVFTYIQYSFDMGIHKLIVIIIKLIAITSLYVIAYYMIMDRNTISNKKAIVKNLFVAIIILGILKSIVTIFIKSIVYNITNTIISNLLISTIDIVMMLIFSPMVIGIVEHKITIPQIFSSLKEIVKNNKSIIAILAILIGYNIFRYIDAKLLIARLDNCYMDDIFDLYIVNRRPVILKILRAVVYGIGSTGLLMISDYTVNCKVKNIKKLRL